MHISNRKSSLVSDLRTTCHSILRVYCTLDVRQPGDGVVLLLVLARTICYVTNICHIAPVVALCCTVQQEVHSSAEYKGLFGPGRLFQSAIYYFCRILEALEQ